MNLTASHLWYTYPRCGWTSQNFWTLGAEYDNEIVVPSVKFYWEYCHGNKPGAAFMIDFALSRSFQLTETLAIPSQYFYGQTLDMVQGNDFVSQQ